MTVQEKTVESTEQTIQRQKFLPHEDVNDENTSPVHEWREQIQKQRTHCVLGNQALTLSEFEETHKHIVLGQN